MHASPVTASGLPPCFPGAVSPEVDPPIRLPASGLSKTFAIWLETTTHAAARGKLDFSPLKP